jgi:hypothetical protein
MPEFRDSGEFKMLHQVSNFLDLCKIRYKCRYLAIKGEQNQEKEFQIYGGPCEPKREAEFEVPMWKTSYLAKSFAKGMLLKAWAMSTLPCIFIQL